MQLVSWKTRKVRRKINMRTAHFSSAAILNVEKALRISGGVRGVEPSDAMMVSSLRENLCSSPISK